MELAQLNVHFYFIVYCWVFFWGGDLVGGLFSPDWLFEKGLLSVLFGFCDSSQLCSQLITLALCSGIEPGGDSTLGKHSWRSSGII